jgi:hypothetical protein
MKVSIWDTYVIKKDKSIMHFDIVAPDYIKNELIIHAFGKDYLKSKKQESLSLTSAECKLCHIEEATENMIASIVKKGYDIIEMEGCD